MPPLASIDALHAQSVDAPHDDLTRRRFLAGTAATAGLLTACTASTEPATTTKGRWDFTDDRGVTVTLESRPQRIIANDRAAGALLEKSRSGSGRGPVGNQPDRVRGGLDGVRQDRGPR